MNTPTPRTDALAAKDFIPDGVWIAHAKKLERELATLTAERDQLRVELERLKPYVSKAVLTNGGTMLCSPQVGVAFNEMQARVRTLETELATERARLDRRFSRDEKSSIAHALDHLLANKIADEGHSGWYCGNRKQFEERHRKSLAFMRSILLPNELAVDAAMKQDAK